MGARACHESLAMPDVSAMPVERARDALYILSSEIMSMSSLLAEIAPF